MATFDGIDVEIRGIAQYTPAAVEQYASADGQQIFIKTFGKSQIYTLELAAIGGYTLPSALLSTVAKHITIQFDLFGSLAAYVQSVQIRASQRVAGSSSVYVEATAVIIPVEV